MGPVGGLNKVNLETGLRNYEKKNQITLLRRKYLDREKVSSAWHRDHVGRPHGKCASSSHFLNTCDAMVSFLR